MSSSARSASPRRRFPVGLPDCPLRKRLWTGGLPYPIGVLSCGAFFFLALIVLLRSGCWRRRSLLRNLFEARAPCGVGRLFAADAPKPTQDGGAIGRVTSISRAKRPVFSAAIRVVPDPPKGSST